LPTNHDSQKTADEAAAVQEIDVCEQDSVMPACCSVNLHRWKPGPHVSHGYKRITTPVLAAEFHVWGCEFTPQRIDYYFDGRFWSNRSTRPSFRMARRISG
jgi:hypothetical protein